MVYVNIYNYDLLDTISYEGRQNLKYIKNETHFHIFSQEIRHFFLNSDFGAPPLGGVWGQLPLPFCPILRVTSESQSFFFKKWGYLHGAKYHAAHGKATRSLGGSGACSPNNLMVRFGEYFAKIFSRKKL